jgi:hypothetical protein
MVDVKTPHITRVADQLGIIFKKILFFTKKTDYTNFKNPIFITMGQLDKNIFGKKKFSDILEEIYNNQKKKEEQISTLISELKPLFKILEMLLLLFLFLKNI